MGRAFLLPIQGLVWSIISVSKGKQKAEAGKAPPYSDAQQVRAENCMLAMQEIATHQNKLLLSLWGPNFSPDATPQGRFSLLLI